MAEGRELSPTVVPNIHIKTDKQETRRKLFSACPPTASYRVYAEALGVGHGKRIVLVCDDQQIGHWVHSQSVIICPVDGAYIKRERNQMSLRQDGLYELQQNTRQSKTVNL